MCHPDEHLTSTDSMLMIHTGPMFLPWHREFIQRFERALREVSGTDITLPYWDWTDQESVSPDNPHAVFREDFMGGDGNPDEQYVVTTGPFRKGAWTLNVRPEGATWAPSATTYLTRRLGRAQALPTKAQVEMALAAEEYDVPPYTAESDPSRSFRSALEGTGSAASGMKCGSDGWMALVSDLPRATPTEPPAPRPPTVPGRSGPTTWCTLGWAVRCAPACDRRSVEPWCCRRRPTTIFFSITRTSTASGGVAETAHPSKHASQRKAVGSNADSAMAPFGDVSPQRVATSATSATATAS